MRDKSIIILLFRFCNFNFPVTVVLDKQVKKILSYWRVCDIFFAGVLYHPAALEAQHVSLPFVSDLQLLAQILHELLDLRPRLLTAQTVLAFDVNQCHGERTIPDLPRSVHAGLAAAAHSIDGDQ